MIFHFARLLNGLWRTNLSSDLQSKTVGSRIKDEVVLVQHFAMVPEEALLHLMLYFPFPIIMWDNLTNELIPPLNHDFLTNLNGIAQLSMEVKLSDLMEYCLLNSIYLCTQHGVLVISAGDSCIGAFYSQQHDATLSLYPMEVAEMS